MEKASSFEELMDGERNNYSNSFPCLDVHSFYGRDESLIVRILSLYPC